MMKDILRDLYFGKYVPDTSNESNDYIQQTEKNLDNVHGKIMEALIEKYGKDKAVEIDNEYTETYAELNSEEMLQAYKSGVYLGMKIMIDLFK